jgi:hypothetical protein
MAKKGKITSILMTNVTAEFAAAYFRVGALPLKINGTPCTDAFGGPALPIVESIKFCKHEFGAGALVQQPCYAIEFEGPTEAMVIPATEFSQITIKVNKEDEAKIPAMPQ